MLWVVYGTVLAVLLLLPLWVWMKLTLCVFVVISGCIVLAARPRLQKLRLQNGEWIRFCGPKHEGHEGHEGREIIVLQHWYQLGRVLVLNFKRQPPVIIFPDALSQESYCRLMQALRFSS